MNADLAPNIIGLVAAVIPLVIIIFQFFMKRRERKTELNDPFIIAKLIKRYPVNPKLWKKIKRRSLIILVSFVIYYFGLFFGLKWLYLYNINNSVHLIFKVIAIASYFLSLFLVIFYFIKNSYAILANADDARYFCFSEIEIIVESNHRYLFNKCQEVLEELKFYLLEVNERERKIEAYYYLLTFTIAIPLKICILIELSDSLNDYRVILYYNPLNTNEKSYLIWKFMEVTITLQRCRFTNRFTKLLLSRLKNSEDMQNGDVTIIDGAGDGKVEPKIPRR